MAKDGQGSFEEAGMEACEVVGFISCGGCPGKRSVLRAEERIKRGAELIMMSSCITKGSPIGFPCPNRGLMLKAIRRKIGDDFPILEFNHY